MPRPPRDHGGRAGGDRDSAGQRWSPHPRLRVGFLVIAVILSVFGARLVQLQGIDPQSYAAMAAKSGVREVVIPARRGAVLDRDGDPVAQAVEGMMVVADPQLTRPDAAELARLLARRLDVDYIETLAKLREKNSRFAYIARRVPATKAEDVVEKVEEAGYEGVELRRDPIRAYPAGDVAANMVGFIGEDEALTGMERTFDERLSGTDGKETYEVGGGNRIPLGDRTRVEPTDGKDLRLTIDRDLQWYTQRVLRQTVEDARGDSGVAIVMDSQTGEVLSLADYPTFDAEHPFQSPEKDFGSRAMSNVYEPGSVFKALTAASLLDAGKVTPRTRLTVPGELERNTRTINDYWEHGRLRLTLAGVIAKSSNIGTVRAADELGTEAFYQYLHDFGLGQRTQVGIRGESRGILPEPDGWTPLGKDRIAFGQAVSVNALQMTAAVNTIANDGVRVEPEVVKGSATSENGVTVGTDTAEATRVVSRKAAHQTAAMMEGVVDPEEGTAPKAAVPGYRVAGKTGTAQRVGKECGCYNGTYTVSFAGFAPASNPRFTAYVLVHNPRAGGGGGSVAGPAFSQLMGYALRTYGVPPTGTEAPQLPLRW